MTNIICILAWMAYAVLEGHREAWYYYYRVNVPLSFFKEENLHTLFTLQRTIVWMLIAILSMSWSIAVGLILIFPFWHDNQYYTQRNNIDSSTYPKRWRDSSTTSTAKIELNFKTRTVLFVIGIAFLTYTFIK